MDIHTNPLAVPPPAGFFRIVHEDGNFRALDPNGKRYRLRPEAGTAVLYVAGTAQVETATVVAASGATSNGNLTVTITAAGMTGSPLALVVPLTTAMNSAALVAAEIRAFLEDAAVLALFTVGGTGATVTLTANSLRANDTTLNIAIAAGLGVTAAATSANTTPGVARVMATPATAGDQMVDADFLYVALADVSPTSATGWVKFAVV